MNVQRVESLDKDASDVEDSSEESTTEDSIGPCSRDHMFGWSRSHLRPKGNSSSHKKLMEKSKFPGVYGIEKQPKIKVNHQMDDVIFLDSASQVTIFKQKDCIDKFLFRKANIVFILVATENHVAIYDVKSTASKAITSSTKIL